MTAAPRLVHSVPPHGSVQSEIADDYLEGADDIAAFLGPRWNSQKVYHARRLMTLPIRRKAGIGLYAFKSELLDALKAPETLTDLTPETR